MLSKETMQLLGGSKKVIDKNKNGERVPRLETVEVVLVHCNLVNSNHQQAPTVLFTFVPDKIIWTINYYHTSFTNIAKNN